MTILFLSAMSGAPWGGSEELWSQAAVRLSREGHAVGASVRHWPELSPKIAALSREGIALHVRRPDSNRIVDRLHDRLIGDSETRWVRQSRPDLVVISQGHQTDGLGWMLFCHEQGLPYLSIVQCNAEIWWPKDGLAERMAIAYRGARKVFCVSRHNLKLLEQQIGERLPQATVAFNPCHVPNHLHGWPPRDEIWKMACVARLDPAAKGQDLLLQAMAQSAWKDRPVEMNFYGGGPYEKGLRRMAESLGLKKVRFRGHSGDVGGIWEQNHLLVLPSRYEGTPLALIEAMWCGRPAVVTDVGGSAEWCLEGQTGFVAPAPSVAVLADALERAWARREDWQALGEAARLRAKELLPEDPVGLFCQQILDPI
jgi:glycosyltransferase involved in cell wall biosynthesis